jgi:hypothetical protein
MSAPSIDDIVMTTDEFVTAWAEHERRTAVLALAARRLEQSGEWAIDGSVSMAAWLRQHCRMSHRDAADLIRAAGSSTPSRSLPKPPATVRCRPPRPTRSAPPAHLRLNR